MRLSTKSVLQRLHEEELRANVALKLTHLGLDLGEEVAYENVRRLVEKASELGNFIRIDMEYSAVVDKTLDIYRRLREDGLSNVGTVLQSYLYRAEDDLESLLPLEPNLRFVKGAYLEPPEVAYPEKSDVDAAYVRLIERSLRGSGYTAIATHDERLIEHAIAFTKREGIGLRPLRVPDALRRPAQAPARPRRARVQGARRHALRAGVVSVSDAPPGRAPCEPRLLPQERCASLALVAAGCPSGRRGRS